MNWTKIVFGGAGPSKNAQRRDLINQIKDNLEMWRDFDSPDYLIEAKRLIDTAD